MIIDCHGHYTTEPKDLHRFRKDQTEAVKNKTALPPRAGLKMSDDEIRESLEANQIKLQKERGTDVTIFSPRASGMGHHVGDENVSMEWTQDLQRPDPPLRHAVPEEFHRRVPVAAVAQRGAGQFGERTRALRQRAWLRRLQPQSGSRRAAISIRRR